MSADLEGMRASIVTSVAAVVLGAGLVAPTATADAASPDAPFAGQPFYLNTNTASSPINVSAMMSKGTTNTANAFVASVPQAIWLTPDVSTKSIASVVANVVTQAAASGSTPVFALYAIPGRDCGLYSAGGFSNTQQYAAWVDAIALGLGGKRAVFIVEPDALMLPPAVVNGVHYGYCAMTDAQINDRFTQLRYAVNALSGAGADVYIDAGHSRWWYPGVPTKDYFGSWFPQEVANRLKRAGVENARGFSLNVSGFFTTSSQEAFGEKVSSLLGGKHYVIDTSRNGNGPTTDEQWCNPDGRALGSLPTTDTSGAHADAYLWVKHPGESDGECGRGEPTSGHWFQSYVDGLYARTSPDVLAGLTGKIGTGSTAQKSSSKKSSSKTASKQAASRKRLSKYRRQVLVQKRRVKTTAARCKISHTRHCRGKLASQRRHLATKRALYRAELRYFRKLGR